MNYIEIQLQRRMAHSTLDRRWTSRVWCQAQTTVVLLVRGLCSRRRWTGRDIRFQSAANVFLDPVWLKVANEQFNLCMRIFQFNLVYTTIWVCCGEWNTTHQQQFSTSFLLYKQKMKNNQYWFVEVHIFFLCFSLVLVATARCIDQWKTSTIQGKALLFSVVWPLHA